MSDIWQSSEESDDLNPQLESRRAESSLYTVTLHFNFISYLIGGWIQDGFQEGVERGMANSMQSGYNAGNTYFHMHKY